LLIAEARVAGSTLLGQRAVDVGLRKRLGVTVIGVWDKGVFAIAVPDTELTATSVLILSASQDQLDAYDRCYGTGSDLQGSVVIIGAGRVGRAAADPSTRPTSPDH
jgi:Trk K+ transport system NAD-binding subunit